MLFLGMLWHALPNNDASSDGFEVGDFVVDKKVSDPSPTLVIQSRGLLDGTLIVDQKQELHRIVYSISTVV